MDGEPWCSSGNLWPNGDLVATGGTRGGVRSVRTLSMADPNANFVEKKNVLADKRWYVLIPSFFFFAKWDDFKSLK